MNIKNYLFSKENATEKIINYCGDYYPDQFRGTITELKPVHQGTSHIIFSELIDNVVNTYKIKTCNTRLIFTDNHTHSLFKNLSINNPQFYTILITE